VAWHVNVRVAALAAACAIAGALGGAQTFWLHAAAKPAATLLLLYIAFTSPQPVSERYRRAISVALVLCLAGDICLLWPIDGFVAGLACFLVAHLCFLRAFADGVGWRLSIRALAGPSVFAAAGLAYIWNGVPDALRAPVAVYVVVLVLMAAKALQRAGTLVRGDVRFASARRAALGALLFLLSDAILAFDRFAIPLPMAALWILSTYYAALFAIARSVGTRPTTSR
jgi:uncharacterized membrane protein YhhN